MVKLLMLAISMALCSCDVVAEMGRDLEANGHFLTKLADQFNPAARTYETPPARSGPPAHDVTPSELGLIY